jgi:hypothetical protein
VRSLSVVLAAAVLACGAVVASLPVSLRAQQAPAGCAGSSAMQFICGPEAAEDFVEVPGTRWLIGSGYGESGRRGRLHLFETRARTWEVLYRGGTAPATADLATYPACDTPPDGEFGAHGIALRAGRAGRHTLYVVNHAREAIEVFDVDGRTASSKPTVAWTGCIRPPDGVYVNSVAILPDGGLVATKFYELSRGIASIYQGQTTGEVLEWQPKKGWTTIPGTALSGANGIEASEDGKWIYVAGWGSQELLRVARNGAASERRTIALGFWPDNIKWTAKGHLLIAGQVRTVAPDRASAPPAGWRIVTVDPRTLAVTELLRDDGTSPLQNLSVAVEVGQTLWLGPFRGDRVGIVPMPKGR